jgi:hypothetical protein
MSILSLVELFIWFTRFILNGCGFGNNKKSKEKGKRQKKIRNNLKIQP